MWIKNNQKQTIDKKYMKNWIKLRSIHYLQRSVNRNCDSRI